MSAGAVDDRSRWVRLEDYTSQSRYSRCRFCGRAQDEDCAPQDCLLCGSRLCHGTGPSCRVCRKGWIPGWWRGVEDGLCGRKGCEEPAVAEGVPRVRRVCATHVEDVRLRWRGRSLSLLEYVAECIAHRDSGAGWERWHFVIVSAEDPSGQHTLVLGTELAAALGTAGATGS
jgi:hypothetical protein